jgi:hypothetical protein
LVGHEDWVRAMDVTLDGNYTVWELFIHVICKWKWLFCVAHRWGLFGTIKNLCVMCQVVWSNFKSKLWLCMSEINWCWMLHSFVPVFNFFSLYFE